jgi:hypothetical protein
VFTVGVTTIEDVFAPLLHVYDAAAPAVKVADCPMQIEGELIAIEPIADTVIVEVVVELHAPVVPVTVYTVVAVGV